MSTHLTVLPCLLPSPYQCSACHGYGTIGGTDQVDDLCEACDGNGFRDGKRPSGRVLKSILKQQQAAQQRRAGVNST